MRWALPMDDIRLTRSLLDQGYNHLDLRLTPTWMASSSEYGVARTPWKRDQALCRPGARSSTLSI